MQIHHSKPIALADSSAATITAETSPDRRGFLRVLLFGSLTAVVASIAGCAGMEKHATPMPPNRMKGGGNRGGASGGSHRG